MPHQKVLAAACAAALSFAMAGAAQAQDALARVKAAGTLHIATEEQFPPYDYIKDGEHVGFNVDLLDAIGQKMGLQLTWTDRPWDRLLSGLQDRKYDLVAGPAPITPDREQAFRFLPPVSSSQARALPGNGAAQTSGPTVYSGYMMRKDEDSASLFNAVSAAMLALKKEGKLAELQVKWFGKAVAVPDKAP